MSSSNRAKAEMRLLAVNDEKRLGFLWRPTTRGYLSDARRETNSALKHETSAAKNGYDSIVDRYNHDRGYTDQIEKHSVPYNMLVERDARYERRKREPLPAHAIPHQVRQMK